MSAKDVYGEKPVIPDYPTASGITSQTSKAILDNFDSANEAVKKINTANQDELTSLLRRTIPGYDELIAKTTENIQSNLEGKLPSGVESELARTSAERGVGSGVSGSDLNRNWGTALSAKERLGRADLGMKQAESWLAASRSLSTAAPLNITSMFLTPAQNMELANGKFQRDVFANQIAAAPNPQVRGEWDSDMSIIGMVLSAYGGGAGYTGAYKGAANGQAGPGQSGYVTPLSNSSGWDYNTVNTGSWNGSQNTAPTGNDNTFAFV